MTAKKRILRATIIGLLSISSLSVLTIAHPQISHININVHAQSAQSDVSLKHNSGIVTLTKPIRAYDSQDGNQRVTIPKGQTIHYQKAPEGVEIWNKKYPKNQNHHYVTVSTDESSLKDQANKDKNNNKRPKGNSNIAAKNKKAMAAKRSAALAKKKQAASVANDKNKKKLPRTSDSQLSPIVYTIAICAIVFSTALIV